MRSQHVSERVEVRPGAIAIAPSIDDPRGFAVQNRSGHPLVVSFGFEPGAHVMVAIVEDARSAPRASEPRRGRSRPRHGRARLH